jgi:hypothetical protein
MKLDLYADVTERFVASGYIATWIDLQRFDTRGF